MNKNVLGPIAVQDKRGWKLVINGVEVTTPVEHVALVNSKFGTLEYGLTSGGYDSWCFSEIGGGGTVIVPNVTIGGKVYVGLVEQSRYTQGGKVWNLPRGFLGAGENHFGAAVRESEEEIRFNLADRFVELVGEPGNSNSAFFVTNASSGVRFFRLMIREDEVEPATDGQPGYVFKQGVLTPQSKAGEQIFRCRFVTLRTATRLSDLFTRGGIAMLRDYLDGE